MIQQYVQQLIQFLQVNPEWGGFLTFIIAFAESLVIIGTIIPGSVTMTAIGVLVGTKIIPLWLTLFWAIVGAFAGDLIGYGIGIYYKERLRNMWPFKKYPYWLLTSESFFKKHGGKSILIGRFIGPARSFIPMIAGLLQMPWQKFIIAAIPSATLWAIAYMLPGILLGLFTLELPPGIATKFIIFLLLIIIGVSLFAWLLKYIFKKSRKLSHHTLINSWNWLRSHEKYHWLTKTIENSQHPDNYHQLALVVRATIFLVSFVIVLIQVLLQGWLTQFNQPLLELLRSLRNDQIDKIMLGITFLGDWHVVLIASVIILMWLIWQRNWHITFHWLILIIIFVVPFLLKYLIFIPRPGGLLNIPAGSSFPSGHTFLGICYFGFLATLIATHLNKRWKPPIYYFVTFLVLFIGLSRLYLGVHWLTDVLGSLLLGLFCVTVLILSYRRKPATHFNFKSFCLLVIIATIISWSIYSLPRFHKSLQDYTLTWPAKNVSLQSWWWGQVNETVPLYRKNRLGKPTEPLNIQWVSSPEEIKAALIRNGWKTYKIKDGFKEALTKISLKQHRSIHLLPALFQNKPPILLLKKEAREYNLLLTLWQSKIMLTNYTEPLIIGNLHRSPKRPKQKTKLIYTDINKDLVPDLQQFKWKIVTVTRHIPISLQELHWNGEILQIIPSRD
jgi:membrane protein DedA with SNARE-associated domain/membrane-associated phospholipid phosphatase